MDRKDPASLSRVIGCNILELRKKMFPEENAADCATKFGVSVSNWYRWESGKVAPSDENQQKLAEFFGITADALRSQTPPAAPVAEPCGQCRYKDFTISKLEQELQSIQQEEKWTLESLDSELTEANLALANALKLINL